MDIKSGKKAWVDGTEVTGQLHGGFTCSGTMNGTRWCEEGDGTIRDMTIQYITNIGFHAIPYIVGSKILPLFMTN